MTLSLYSFFVFFALSFVPFPFTPPHEVSLIKLVQNFLYLSSGNTSNMATKPKESASLVKKKKAASPSDHHQTSMAQTKRPSPTLKQSNLLSSPTTSVAPTASDKQLPNYLKPTLSSRVESPKPATKKHVSLLPGASAQKPHLSRRNSFDKSESSAQMQKIYTSSSPRERSLTVKSLSFSSQSSGLARPVLDRTSKTPKAGPAKSQASTIAGNKATRKSSVSTPLTIKKETGRLSRTPSNPDEISEILNAESGNLDNKKPEVKDVEEVVVVKVESDHAVDVAPDLQKPEDIVDEHDDIILAGDELVKDQETLVDQARVISTVEDHIHDSTESSQGEAEDTEDKLTEQEATETLLGDKIGEDKDQISNDETDIIQEEISTEVATPEDKIEDHAHKKTDTITAETGEAEATSEKPEQAGEEQNQNKPISSDDERKDAPAESTVKEEAKPLTIKTISPSKSQRPSQGNSKKESPAYNDVIAETSSKLMEKRKNKVKALVGAFETVISLEEPQA